MMIEVACVQGSIEWAEGRRGKGTASRLPDVMTAKTQKLAAGATTYACELIAEEIVSPRYWIDDDYQSRPMRNGLLREDEARRYFELETNQDVRQVGLCVSDCQRWACSPDGLVGDDAGLELKSPLHRTQVRWLLDGVIPSEYVNQVHGSMIITMRPTWWFLSYAPGLPPLLIEQKVTDYTRRLAEVMEEFWVMYQNMRSRIIGAGDPVAATRQPVTPYF